MFNCTVLAMVLLAATQIARAAVTAAFSVFCLLTGIGAWLVESPPSEWIASRMLWVAVLLAVGVALVPVWIRLGFRVLPPAAPPAPGGETLSR